MKTLWINGQLILQDAISRLLGPVHTREDPYGSDPKLVRIGLLCTLAPTYPLQFGSAIGTNEIRIKSTEPCGSDPFGSRKNPLIRSKRKVQIGSETNFAFKEDLVLGCLECLREEQRTY